jgi:hypothetical protein
MFYNVLIVGAGQLGSRYLQGLAKCTIPLSVYVCDVSQLSLDLAESRWLEVGGDKTPHNIELFIGFDGVPAHIDLAIISTNAFVRPKVVKQVAEKSQVRYWLLEKVLAQSEEKIKQIQSIIGVEGNAWVNTPLRSMDWYHKIKSEMIMNGSFSCVIKAGKTFGIACNTIHYLDLLEWLSGETVVKLITTGLDTKWFESKRAGFWDIFGTIEVVFSKGSKAYITSDSSQWMPITIKFKTRDEEWMIHESEGFAIRNNDLKITGRDEYQSEITAPIVESILLTGTCQLPLLAESVAMHIPMLRDLLEHWNLYMPEKITELPIT